MAANPARKSFWNTMPKSLAMQGVNTFVGRNLRGSLKAHVKQLQVDLHEEFPDEVARRAFELVRDNIYGWPS